MRGWGRVIPDFDLLARRPPVLPFGDDGRVEVRRVVLIRDLPLSHCDLELVVKVRERWIKKLE